MSIFYFSPFKTKYWASQSDSVTPYIPLIFFFSCMVYSGAGPASSATIIKTQFDFWEMGIHF